MKRLWNCEEVGSDGVVRSRCQDLVLFIFLVRVIEKSRGLRRCFVDTKTR